MQSIQQSAVPEAVVRIFGRRKIRRKKETSPNNRASLHIVRNAYYLKVCLYIKIHKKKMGEEREKIYMYISANSEPLSERKKMSWLLLSDRENQIVATISTLLDHILVEL